MGIIVHTHGRFHNMPQSELLVHGVNTAYRIAGNFRWVQIFAIFADRPASTKIKTAKKCTKMEIVTSLRAYVVDTN